VRLLALLLLAATGAAAGPFITADWSSPEKDAVTIRSAGWEESALECLESGKQARVRFEARLCRRRAAWLDRCESSRSEVHTLEYDGITESYRLVADRFGDVPEATAVGIPSREEAVRELLRSESLPLAFLGREEPELVQNRASYLSVRTIFRCKGTSSRTFAHLSRLLTFGVLDVVESRSDWHEFALFPEGRRPDLGERDSGE